MYFLSHFLTLLRQYKPDIFILKLENAHELWSYIRRNAKIYFLLINANKINMSLFAIFPQIQHIGWTYKCYMKSFGSTGIKIIFLKVVLNFLSFKTAFSIVLYQNHTKSSQVSTLLLIIVSKVFILQIFHFTQISSRYIKNSKFRFCYGHPLVMLLFFRPFTTYLNIQSSVFLPFTSNVSKVGLKH